MKRNKKHNHKLSKIRQYQAALKPFAVISTNQEGGICKLITVKGGREVNVTQSVYNAIAEIKHMWNIYIAVFGEVGEEVYTKANQVVSDKPYYQHELAAFLNEKHVTMLKSFNQNHLTGFGWIASPAGHDFTEEHAFNLFRKQGCLTLKNN